MSGREKPRKRPFAPSLVPNHSEGARRPREGEIGASRGKRGRGPGRLSEREWQRQVLEYARLRGWRAAHFRPARISGGRWRTPVAADGAGFPDLVLARGGRVIFAELKAEGGRLSAEQRAWLEALREAGGVEVHVWRPKQWDEVEEVLR